MAAHGIFQRQFGEDSLTATEIDVSSNEDEPSRRSPCLLPLPGIAVPPVLDAPVPRLPSSPRESGTSFSSAALFTEVADLTSAESPSGNPQRLPPKDEEDLPLSVIFAAGLPSTPRLSKAGDGSDSSDVVEIPIPQGSTPKVKRGCHLISSPETTPRKARPRLASPDHGTPRTATPKKPTPKKATPDRAPPKKATPEKATPKKSTPEKAAPPKKPAPERASLTGGRSPKPPAEPEAKAQKRKTLAQRLQDRQKTARQAKAKAKAKVSKAEAYKAKVERTEQLLADTIRGDRKFYEKLLCFEVMEIEELAKKIRSANEGLRSLGRKRIRDFLEAQGFVVTQQKKLPREVFEKSMFRGYR